MYGTRGSTKRSADSQPHDDSPAKKPTSDVDGYETPVTEDTVEDVKLNTSALPSNNNPAKPYCTVHVLEGGKQMMFTDETVASAYWNENLDSITETLKFNSKDEHDVFSKQNKPMSTPNPSIKQEKLTPEETQTLAMIKKNRQKNAPTKNLRIHFKTNSFSESTSLV